VKVIIGVDPHKASHTAVAISGDEDELGSLKVRATRGQVDQLVGWAEPFPARTWAIESAGGLGYLLAQQLVAAGEDVVDVPATLASRVRVLASGRSNKNDPNDALAVAVAALRTPALRPVAAADHAEVLRLLAKRNTDIGNHRTRLVCRLHAQLAELAPGGIAKELNASDAEGLLAGLRPATPVEQARHELALELLDDVRRLDAQLKESHRRIRTAVRASQTSLTELFGVGPIIAGMLIGYAGDVRRFRNADQFAAYNGTAPVEFSSGGRTVHRLSQRGSRLGQAGLASCGGGDLPVEERHAEPLGHTRADDRSAGPVQGSQGDHGTSFGALAHRPDGSRCRDAPGPNDAALTLVAPSSSRTSPSPLCRPSPRCPPRRPGPRGPGRRRPHRACPARGGVETPTPPHRVGETPPVRSTTFSPGGTAPQTRHKSRRARARSDGSTGSRLSGAGGGPAPSPSRNPSCVSAPRSATDPHSAGTMTGPIQRPGGRDSPPDPEVLQGRHLHVRPLGQRRDRRGEPLLRPRHLHAPDRPQRLSQRPGHQRSVSLGDLRSVARRLERIDAVGAH
jgi:transposase